MISAKRTAAVFGTVGLVVTTLVTGLLLVGALPAAHASGDTIKVPDDHGTIQAAVNAAADGDAILVAESDYAYKENLTVTKGITLSGGWDSTYTTQTLGSSVIDGQGLGRVISITCSLSDTVVTIDGFTIARGDATGLGAPVLPEPTDADASPQASSTFGSDRTLAAAGGDPVDPSERAAVVRAHLTDLAARGLYPGGESTLESTLAQLDWRTAQAEEALSRAGSLRTSQANEPAPGPGVGGGVFSWNASLHLLNSTIRDNLASTLSDGLGGGIYAGQAAPGGTVISHNAVKYNTAGKYAGGRGGGLYLHKTPGAVVEDNHFRENAASNGGLYGAGGGLYVDASPGAIVQRNLVERNTGHASWDCPGVGGGGTGGGAQVRASDGAVVRDNVLQHNLSALRCGSHTGGLYVYRGGDVQVLDNQVLENWGVLYQLYTDDYGGGIGLDTLHSASVTGNYVSGNFTSLNTPDRGWNVSYGGGIYGSMLSASRLMSNTLIANVASGMHTAFGGGMYLEGTTDVTVAHNDFDRNSGSLSDHGGGTAGGLDLRNTVGTLVLDNRFTGNRASTVGPGKAGGLGIASWGPSSIDNTVDSNVFLDNVASGGLSEDIRGGACVLASHGLSIVNNVVAGNKAYKAGGVDVVIAEHGTITNNTFVENSDAAVVNNEWTTPVTITNNIVVRHTLGITVGKEATAVLRYNLFDGNATDIAGSGTITETASATGDPSFVSAANHDYHLTYASVALDGGDPAGVPPAPGTDADGVARPQGGRVDIGAYERPGYLGRVYMPVAGKPAAPRTGWAIGDDETGTASIVHTADSGMTWQLQGDSSEWAGLDAADVSAVDDLTAWVALSSPPASSDGAILNTTDGGDSWVRQTIPSGIKGGIKGIKGLSRHEAWAASSEGVILHTLDGGATWTVVPHPSAPITEVNRIDAMGEDVWIADPYGSMVHTSDGGLTWRLESLPGDSPLVVHAHSPQVAWASAMHHAAFYRTTTGGDQWDLIANVGGLDHLDDLCAVGADSVWGVLNGGGIDGAIWHVGVAADGTPTARSATPTDLGAFTPGGITCLDSKRVWFVAQFQNDDGTEPQLGRIYHTEDGEHWFQQTAPTRIKYWKITFVGALR